MSETTKPAADDKRLQLVWPGTPTQVERVKLPFKVTERVPMLSPALRRELA